MGEIGKLGEFGVVALAKIGADGCLLELRSSVGAREAGDIALGQSAAQGERWIAISQAAAARAKELLDSEEIDSPCRAAGLAALEGDLLAPESGKERAADPSEAFWTAPARRGLEPRRRFDGSRR